MKAKYILILLMFASISFAQEKRVLIELFTNSHCPLCVSAYSAANSYISSNMDKVDVIYYHMSFPYSDDALYQANRDDANLRNNYYGPYSSTPKALFNGVLQSNSYGNWPALLNNQLNESATFDIELTGSKDGSNVSINSNITRLAETSDSDLILNLVIVEDVNYTGRNGISVHDNVMRKIGTGANGISVNVAINESKRYSQNLEIQDSWNMDSISIVAFIQSKSSKKIYHSETIDYNSLSVTSIEDKETVFPKDFSLDQNYPNPFNPSTTIEYSIPATSSVQVSNVILRIFNVLGKEVRTLVNENQQQGNYKITFDASDFTSGTYFYQLTYGGKTITKKMLLMK